VQRKNLHIALSSKNGYKHKNHFDHQGASKAELKESDNSLPNLRHGLNNEDIHIRRDCPQMCSYIENAEFVCLYPVEPTFIKK